MDLPNCIAIDGPAGSGKSTVGEILAKDLNYVLFDTGVMYRAVTLAALEKYGSVEDEDAVSALAETVQIDVLAASIPDGRKYAVILDDRDITWDIRKPEVDRWVSPVSAYGRVRQAMTAQQRRIGQRGRVVMVGRDIGTVVMPDAELKIYLVASVEERARRRYLEICERGENGCYEEILTSMRRRDEIDSSRTLAPLKPAADAQIVDTDGLTLEQVVANIKKLIDDPDNINEQGR